VRRSAFVLVAVFVAAACAGTTSTAARPVAKLTPPPAVLTTETVWNATLTVRPAPARRPVVVARPATGTTRTFATQSSGRGRYRVRLVLAQAGRWALSARVGKLTAKLRAVTVAEAPPPASPLAGATATRVCAGAGIPYPQYALALGAGSLWVACGRKHQVLRVEPASGRIQALISVPNENLGLIAADASGVWTLAVRGGAAYRIDPAADRVVAQVPLDGEVPYFWVGAGSAWAADDSTRTLLRIDPATNRTSARLSVGNGTSAFVTDGRRAWVLNHRENSLDRIDLATNAVTRLATGLGPADNSAVERIALRDGTLWVTGRGADLLRVSPESGAVLGTTEIGPAGIDVAATADSVWVAVFEAAAEPRGDPVVGEVVRIDPRTGAVAQRIVPDRKLFLTGLVSDGANVWLLDSVTGLLLRLPS
jgi:streptogramin lyase